MKELLCVRSRRKLRGLQNHHWEKEGLPFRLAHSKDNASDRFMGGALFSLIELDPLQSFLYRRRFMCLTWICCLMHAAGPRKGPAPSRPVPQAAKQLLREQRQRQ